MCLICCYNFGEDDHWQSIFYSVLYATFYFYALRGNYNGSQYWHYYSIQSQEFWNMESKTFSGCWREVSIHLPCSTPGHLATDFPRFLLHSCKFWGGLQFSKSLWTLMQPFLFTYISIKHLTLKITKLLFFFSHFAF